MPKSLSIALSGLFLCLALSGADAPHAEKKELDPQPKETTLSRAPYLQMTTPQTVTIVWRTLGASKPAVRYGKTAQSLTQTVNTGIVVRTAPHVEGNAPKLHSSPDWTYQCEATLTGLTEDSAYFYAIFDGDKKLAGGDDTYRFVTHPKVGVQKNVRIWVVGDSGTGGKEQAAVHTAMVNWTASTRRPIDMYLHVGDMAYGTGLDKEFQNFFFKMYEPTLRNVACWPSMGNHEGKNSKGISGIGPYYDAYVVPTKGEAGGVPSGTEAYYSYVYGNIHFICLDSHDLDRKPDGAMAKWLKADLEKAKADWLIAFWHHPPYSKGTHDSDTEGAMVEMRKYIMPILESGGVDLVLTGHSHIYERSMLVDGAYGTPTVAENFVFNDGDGNLKGDGAYKKSAGLNPNEGDVQIVAGHGGAGLGRCGTLPIFKSIIVEHGSVILDLDGNTLTSVMINKNGEERDRFSIVKEGKQTPKRIANPKQLPVFVPEKKEKKKKE